MQELRGRVAVVTGAGSGIGAALVAALAGSGMKVVAGDVDPAAARATAEAAAARGGEARGVSVDVRDPASLASLADETFDAFGACHLLCNNAGVMVNRPITELEPGDWEWVLGVNLWGVIHGVSAFLPRMLAQGGEAHIANTASFAGLVAMGGLGLGAYTTSKFAVVGYTEFLRAELAGTAIGVTAICPGAVVTRIAESERNRPAELATGARDLADADPSKVADTPGLNAIPADDAAAIIVAAIRENRPYAITHPDMWPLVAGRNQALAAAFGADADTGGPA